MARIYLDYAATAPLRPGARAAVVAALDLRNPGSLHQEGQSARMALDTSRRTVADLLGVRAERVVFTSGGSESNNLALRGFAAANPGKRLAVSAVEHPCIAETAQVLGGVVIPVSPEGVVELAALETLLKQGNVGLVSIMHANNETGVLQPLKDIAALCHAHGALLHTDAVQAVGHLPVQPDALGVDMLTFTAHKLGGPKGAGVLVSKPEVTMHAQQTGGGQERNRRAGTENVAAIVGLAAALEAALSNLEAETAQAAALAATLENALPTGVTLAGGKAEKVPHIRQLILPRTNGEDAVIALDLQGIAASRGSACSSGRTTGSKVLRAMGFAEDDSKRALRLSWGWASGADDTAAALAALARL